MRITHKCVYPHFGPHREADVNTLPRRQKRILRPRGRCVTKTHTRTKSKNDTGKVPHSRPITNNFRLILTYLVPCHLLNTHTLPSSRLLEPYPRLEQLFRPLARCIKTGDLAGFDAALAAGEDEFVRRRVYLTLERGRDIALRNLFRKVYLTAGYDDANPPMRKSRVPVADFAAAMRLGNQTDSNTRTDIDEVECLLANMIYKVSRPWNCRCLIPQAVASSFLFPLSILFPELKSTNRAT
jgi:hypothetical protein